MDSNHKDAPNECMNLHDHNVHHHPPTHEHTSSSSSYT